MPSLMEDRQSPSARASPRSANSRSGRAPMESALAGLEEASLQPARMRQESVAGLVATVCDAAYTNGLHQLELQRLVGLLTRKNHLDQTSLTSLAKCIYPLRRVPSQTIVNVVSCLGHAQHKPSAATQALMLKWLCSVHDFVEDANIFSRLYGALFSLLDMMSLRQRLCQLLVLITRRKHVQRYRVLQLTELYHVSGKDPSLENVLRIFQELCPDQMLISVTSGRFSRPLPFDREWRHHHQSLLQAHASENRSLQDMVDDEFPIPQAKRQRVSTLPALQTYGAASSSVTLEEIRDAEHFVESFEKIELPNHLASSLVKPWLRRYLELCASETSRQRMENWLSSWLATPFEGSDNGVGTVKVACGMIADLWKSTRDSKVVSAPEEIFLRDYIRHWDGISRRAELLDMVAFIHPTSFDDYSRWFLVPIERKLLCFENGIRELLSFYVAILRCWVNSFDFQSLSPQASDHRLRIIANLFDHFSERALHFLSDKDSAESSIAGIIEFYEVSALSCFSDQGATQSQRQPRPVLLPSKEIFYLLFLNAQTSGISQICVLLATYKEALEASKRTAAPPKADIVNQFNGYLVDVSNSLWRARAFREDDLNANGCFCPESIRPLLQAYLESLDRDYTLVSSLGLSWHPNLSSVSLAALKDCEDRAEGGGEELLIRHAGPATQHSLQVLDKDGGLQISWKEYRLSVLEYLDKHSLGGLKMLMYRTIKDLMRVQT